MESQNPAPSNALEIDAGYRTDLHGDGESESYSKIAFYGKLLSEVGVPFKYAQAIDLTDPVPTVGEGDRNSITLSFEKGTTMLGGGLLEAEGVKPLALRGLETAGIRGTALFALNTDKGNDNPDLVYAAGLESKPMRIPGFKNTEASNWLVFGLNGQRQEDDKSKNFGLLTYRGFLGKAFFWRKSADVGKTAAKLSEQILAVAPTYAKALEVRKEMEDMKLGKNKAMSQVQELVYDNVIDIGPDEVKSLSENEKDEYWRKKVRDASWGVAEEITDQPTLSAYLEASGWYTFSGDPQGSRQKNLLTATVDYWFLPNRDDVFLRMRYELGYERAAPTFHKNNLLASVALRL